jgi:hypothetical protein
MLAMGCATTGARQDTETTPAPLQQDGDSDENFVQGPDAGTEEPAAELPENIQLRFLIPDGWDMTPDPEQNRAVFTHRQTNSRIMLSMWPAEQGGTPQEFINEVWVAAVEDSMGDSSADVSMPMALEYEGRDVSTFTVVRRQSNGVRVMMRFVGSESSHPALNILLIGIWPERASGSSSQNPTMNRLGPSPCERDFQKGPTCTVGFFSPTNHRRQPVAACLCGSGPNPHNQNPGLLRSRGTLSA